MAEQDSGLFWRSQYSEAVAPELTPLERQLRDQFITEYLIDFDMVRAAMRCGFHKGYAEQYANQFMDEPYVQCKLKELQHTTPADDTLERAQFARRVFATLTEAMNVGPYASRVAAASRMSAILGMEAPAKSEQTITHRGGVMAVPGILGLDEWEKVAQQSQDKLVSDTRA